MDTYDINGSYVSVGGGAFDGLDSFAQKWIGGHYMIVFGLLVFLTLLVLFFIIHLYREGFNPTATMRGQARDDERMEGDRSKSVFAQQVQGANKQFTIDPNAAPGTPGSLSWQVANSPDFDCANRSMNHEDAWAWMKDVSKENYSGPTTDNEYSRIIAGRR